ncbi:MAG: YitT family protein [Oscillospiraceae bacterium]|jgi:uncharacterized membrane-anchored protein YitT (DUF2179 family)|nr:YitT family protein [Oscillospiraceae bacterium]
MHSNDKKMQGKIFSHTTWIFCVIIGSLLIAIGVSVVDANGWLASGVMGTGLLLQRVFGIPLPISNFLLNGAIVALILKTRGKAFFAKSIFAISAISIFLAVVPIPILPDLIPRIAVAVASGIVIGAGIGIINMTSTSSGGSDSLVNAIVAKFNKLHKMTLMWIIDATILTIGFFIYGMQTTLLSVAVVILTGGTARAILKQNDDNAADTNNQDREVTTWKEMTGTIEVNIQEYEALKKQVATLIAKVAELESHLSKIKTTMTQVADSTLIENNIS